MWFSPFVGRTRIIPKRREPPMHSTPDGCFLYFSLSRLGEHNANANAARILSIDLQTKHPHWSLFMCMIYGALMFLLLTFANECMCTPLWFPPACVVDFAFLQHTWEELRYGYMRTNVRFWQTEYFIMELGMRNLVDCTFFLEVIHTN